MLIVPYIDYCNGFLTGLSAIIFLYPQFISHTDDVINFLERNTQLFNTGI